MRWEICLQVSVDLGAEGAGHAVRGVEDGILPRDIGPCRKARIHGRAAKGRRSRHIGAVVRSMRTSASMLLKRLFVLSQPQTTQPSRDVHGLLPALRLQNTTCSSLRQNGREGTGTTTRLQVKGIFWRKCEVPRRLLGRPSHRPEDSVREDSLVAGVLPN
jgi:hypothetical protein